MADDGKRIMHAHLKLNGGSLMLNDDFPESWPGAAGRDRPASRCTSRCRMPTRRGSARSTPAAKALPLADQFWGDRYGS